jgi:hypothetical protein
MVITTQAVAAWLFAALGSAVIAFQLALAAGAPWGSLAMGGRFPGRFPAPMRAAAIVQGVLFAALIVIVLARAGLVMPEQAGLARIAVWAVVALMAASAIMNLITPSKWERRIWAPVAGLLLVASVHVAFG